MAASQGGLDGLIGGPTAAGVPGDIVLENRHVRFVVRNEERSLLLPSPGALVHADIVRPDGEPGQDRFFEVFSTVGVPRVFHVDPSPAQPGPAEASGPIVDDGAQSGTAVVRFTGTDGGMTIIDSSLPTEALGLEVTLEYALGTDDRAVEIRTIIHNPASLATSVSTGVALQPGDRLAPSSAWTRPST